MVDASHGRSRRDPGVIPPPFDSMANLRTLGEIQRRGLEAANLVVARLIDQIDRGGPLFGAEPPDAASNGEDPGATPNVSALVDQYTSLASAFLKSLVDGQRPSGTPARGIEQAASGPVRADPLTLSPTAPGARVEGELWLHNRSGAMAADIRVHCGDLRRHDGWAVPSTAIRFEPPCLEELPDLSSRGIRVTVDLPPDTPPGIYRGTVLAANLPELWLVVELDVVDPP